MKTPSAPRTRLALAASCTAFAALLAGCAASPTAPESSTASGGFPVTIDNCGHPVEIESRPERIVLVNNDALANLEALGAVDRIVAVTATPAPGLYDEVTYDALDELTPLSTDENATGGSVVSQESILGTRPDLVIAPENAVDREALAAVGVPLYTPTAYCANPPAAYTETATFDRVWDELETYGRLLGEEDAAASVIAEAEAALEETEATDAGTAAALYVSSGGSVLSPYGGPSMVTPVFEAAGLTNAYADEPQRVFDASLEDIIARDPGTIVLLHSGDDADATRAAFLSAPGVDGLRAVQDGRVLTLLFPYTDPPSVLTARGPAVLAGKLAELP